MWPTDDKSEKQVSNFQANLRYLVSKKIANLSAEKPLNTFVGVKGQTKWMGRYRVFDEYINVIMKTKIHVGAQRDFWEDHFRLFEALISGAHVDHARGSQGRRIRGSIYKCARPPIQATLLP
jgi:hypothetical protein